MDSTDMGGKDQEGIAPIRTRGPFQTRGTPLEEPVSAVPIRTRGAFPRGPAPRAPIELGHLVNELRRDEGDLTITSILHGWGSEPTRTFSVVLHRLLHEDDALWIVPGEDGEPAEAPREAVRLDLTRQTDRRTYSNLVATIIFFPAATEAEIETTAQWKGRTRALIVHARGPMCDACLKAGGAELSSYRWTGDRRLEAHDPGLRRPD